MEGSTLGAWETLGIHVTRDVPRFVPISTKRAREKVQKGGQFPNSQLISLFWASISWKAFSSVAKAPCRGNQEREWELSQRWGDGEFLGNTLGNQCSDLESQVATAMPQCGTSLGVL